MLQRNITMKKFCSLIGILLTTIAIRSENVNSDLSVSVNTNEESDNYNVVDPLDIEFYGIIDDNDELDDADTLQEIEDELEDALEEIESEEQDSEDEKKQNYNMPNKRRMWKKVSRQSARKVFRFMNRKNISSISEVPKRKFHGKFRRVHKKVQNKSTPLKRKLQNMHRKMEENKQRKMAWKNTEGKMQNICKKIGKVTKPRAVVLNKLSRHARRQYIDIFTKRKQTISDCCLSETSEERRTCLQQSYLEKLISICNVNSRKQRKQMVNRWHNKNTCCQFEEIEEKQECFMEVSRHIRQGKWNKRETNPRKRLAKVCKNVMRPTLNAWHGKMFARMNQAEKQKWRQIFTQRRQNMKICCQKPGVEKFQCAEKIRSDRLERVCRREEDYKPLAHLDEDKHSTLVEKCCNETNGKRLDCFSGRRRPSNTTWNVEEENQGNIEFENEDASFEIQASNGRFVRSAESRRKRLNRRRKNRGNKQQKKEAKEQCCTAGENVRAEILEKAAEVTEDSCLSERPELLDSVEKIRSKKCQKVFLKCCTLTLDQIAQNKRERKEKRKERRKNRKTQEDNRDVDAEQEEEHESKQLA